MVYIRGKRIKGEEYLYLVRSVWDGRRKTARQHIIKYLGNASGVKPEDIPPEYRDEPKVARFLRSRMTPGDDISGELASSMYHSLTEGDIDGALSTYYESVRLLGSVESFFDLVLRPALYDIGERWAAGRLDIATEHVASNVAQSLVRIITDRAGGRRGKGRILLCVPPGEEHHMGCDIIEAYMTGRGFMVYNMGTSVPAEDILRFMAHNRPDVVMMSVSMSDSVTAAKRMADKISAKFKTPVVMGGYAFRDGSPDVGGHTVVSAGALREVPRSVRRVMRERPAIY